MVRLMNMSLARISPQRRERRPSLIERQFWFRDEDTGNDPCCFFSFAASLFAYAQLHVFCSYSMWPCSFGCCETWMLRDVQQLVFEGAKPLCGSVKIQDQFSVFVLLLLCIRAC